MSTRESYDMFLETLRGETGSDAFVADDGGLVSVCVDGHFNLNLQFIEPQGKILCFVEMARLPADAPREVYRALLAGGLFGRETAGGYFAIEPETETVVYTYMFDFERAEADIGEFVSTIEKILQLCDVWDERIRSALADGGAQGVPDAGLGPTADLIQA